MRLPNYNTNKDDTGTQTGIWYSLFFVLIDLWHLPSIWEERLNKMAIPELLRKIEKEATPFTASAPPQEIIGLLIRIRTMATIRWRRNRCLLKGLLLIYFSAKAGRPAVFHLSCHLTQTGSVTGHCWVSQPKGAKNGSVKLKDGWVEIYTHRLIPPNTN